MLITALCAACSSPGHGLEGPQAPAAVEHRIRERVLARSAAPDSVPLLPLTADQAVREALAASPELEQIEQRMRAAAEQARQATASLYPRLLLSEEWSATDNPVYALMHIINQRRLTPNVDFNDPGWERNFGTQVRAEWTVFDGAGRAAAEDAARSRQRAFQAEVLAGRNRLAGAVLETFYRWLQSLDAIRTVEQAGESAAVNARLGAARAEAGAALPSEVLRLKSRVAELKGELAAARASSRRLQAALERLLARPIRPEEIPDPQAESVLPHLEVPDAPVLLERALELRSEIAVAAHLVRAASERVRSAGGELWPTIGVYAQYQLDSERLREFEDSWLAGVQALYPFFDGGATRARVAEAEAGLREAEARGVQIGLDIALEVQHAAAAVAEAAERIEAAAERRKWSQAALRETQELYRGEAVTVDALLQAETESSRAEAAYRAALFEGRIAKALLAQAAGDLAGSFEETHE